MHHLNRYSNDNFGILYSDVFQLKLCIPNTEIPLDKNWVLEHSIFNVSHKIHMLILCKNAKKNFCLDGIIIESGTGNMNVWWYLSFDNILIKATDKQIVAIENKHSPGSSRSLRARAFLK